MHSFALLCNLKILPILLVSARTQQPLLQDGHEAPEPGFLIRRLLAVHLESWLYKSWPFISSLLLYPEGRH